ncbi:MAG: phosphatidate cytidylyltransferase [Acidobacteria bacterium]|nr:phosphatidate cytidylyltransferase [Acidobacteriota bacterium]
MTRVLTALVLAAIVIPAVKWAPPWAWWALLLVAGVGAVLELQGMLGRLGRTPWLALSLAGTITVALSIGFAPSAAPPLLTAVVLAALLAALAATGPLAPRVDRVLGTLFVVAYLGLTGGYLGALGTVQLPGATDRGDMLILAMVAVYVGDIFALYGGRAFGRHPLAPVISPKKTWEGAIAGLAGSVAGALLAPLWFARALPVRHAVALGLLLGIVGIAGDLAESLLKRAAEVKDSGTLLPGHGGILDRIDSLLFAAPVLYSYYALFLAG